MKKALIALGCVAAAAAGVAGYAVAASSSDPAASCDPPSYDGTNLTLHCVVPQATNTVTDTATVTQTETATITETATETVPGPTVTETQTVTVTPAPTTTPPPTTPPPSGSWAPGQDVHAANTGLAGDGINPSTLTPLSGFVTYDSTFNNQTITLKAYNSKVTITGSHITVKDCTMTTGGQAAVGFLLQGSYNTVQNCDITSPAGQSAYEPVWVFGDHNQVLNNNISRGENLLTTYGTNVTITGNYMHDVSTDSSPGGHPDGIEIYGGGPTLILNNRIEEDNLYDAPINIGPYNSYTVHDLTVQGNFLDGGQSVILQYSQNPNHPADGVTNTRILHNAFGGHQCPSSNPQCFHIFHPSLLQPAPGRVFVETEAALAADPVGILWPTSGPDVSKWEESADIETSSTPHDGDVVIPVQS